MTDGDESFGAQKIPSDKVSMEFFSFFSYSRSIKIAFTKNAAAPKFILEKEIFLHSQMAATSVLRK